MNSDAYYHTMKRKESLVNFGLQSGKIEHLHFVWECSWNETLKRNPEIKKLISTYNLSAIPTVISLREAFRGGQCDPAAIFADANQIAEAISKKVGHSVPPQPGFMIDYTSQYPSTLVKPTAGAFDKAVDYVPIPTGAPVTLWGPDAEVACNSTCYHTCSSDCETDCVVYLHRSRRCRRMDSHLCDEGNECFQTCDKHHPLSDYGKCPAFAQVLVLPPKDELFPVLRKTVRDCNGI
jgi:hypothetical protein